MEAKSPHQGRSNDILLINVPKHGVDITLNYFGVSATKAPLLPPLQFVTCENILIGIFKFCFYIYLRPIKFRKSKKSENKAK